MNDVRANAVLADDPGHRHFPLYRQLLLGVQDACPELAPARHASLAAGLTDAYLRSLTEQGRALRLDETVIRDLVVVSGRVDAPTPSLFVVARTSDVNSSRVFTPLSAADIPAGDSLAPHAQQRTIGPDGYLTDSDIVRTAIAGLERESMFSANAIVLHRTAGSSTEGTLNHWRSSTRPLGTHFLIDKDGTIHQTASLSHQTRHVGEIRSRAEVESALSPEEAQNLRLARAAPGNNNTAVHRLESGHAYPKRFPTSKDSIGIEVVGAYNTQAGTWDAATPQQSASISRLVQILQNNFGLDDHDIYQHDAISYKTAGEGGGLYEPAPRDLDAHGVQPSAGLAR